MLKHTLIPTILITFLLTASLIQTNANQNQSEHTPNTIADYYQVEILITLEVRDKAGNDVTDLRHDELAIYENGIKQILTSLRREESKIGGVLHTRYEATYLPIDNHCDGKFRRIQVKNLTQRKLTFHIKPKGYFARKEMPVCKQRT